MHTRKISEVIAGRPILTGPADLTVSEAARLMAAAKVGSIMLTEGGRLIGIFTERDALVRVLAAGLAPQVTPVAHAMTTHVMTATPEMPLGHALHLMFEGGFRHVPVVSDGRPVGMVSARDALGPELVEFEGELLQREAIAEVL
ncbi:CBS domain-containing protein [Aromatoleum evansii]|uniref:CBS domain-containing protein n=1 Tax=Aromatoleum evansii TaxID=59406 RepID=A0ABZ1AJS8_AROEV|nr:CBS domain-containing protein [Aromatoleum evansii]